MWFTLKGHWELHNTEEQTSKSLLSLKGFNEKKKQEIYIALMKNLYNK